jgi:UDP-N-acetylmuramyl tripeptide synthase
MHKSLVIVLGKAIKNAAKLRGGGSALPGLIAEKIDPNFVSHILSTLPLGVVVVSGTNGKTTTTKIIVELLEGQGLKVFTNKTGSNFTRGIAAALLGEVNIKGHLRADIAVLELDEAHAVHFVNKVAPKYSLILNVMRDQLDRFGEIDHTTNLLRHIANATTEAVILNREDPRIANIARSLDDQKVHFFGLDKDLIKTFPSDDELHNSSITKDNNIKADVILSKINDDTAWFTIDDSMLKTSLKLTGVYNLFNAAAAIATVKTVLGAKTNKSKLIKDLANIKPAFGRGETLMINDKPIELILVKNPSGFRLGLKSFNSSGYATMIVINDNYADSRDMSWLWDVDFSSLSCKAVAQISGSRAYDMALRLQYNDVKFKDIDTDIKKALKKFLNKYPKSPKRIYCTYTAMITVRKSLSKITKVEVIR